MVRNNDSESGERKTVVRVYLTEDEAAWVKKMAKVLDLTVSRFATRQILSLRETAFQWAWQSALEGLDDSGQSHDVELYALRVLRDGGCPRTVAEARAAVWEVVPDEDVAEEMWSALEEAMPALARGANVDPAFFTTDAIDWDPDREPVPYLRVVPGGKGAKPATKSKKTKSA